MKKIVILMIIIILASCSNLDNTKNNLEIENLEFVLSPVFDPELLLTTTDGLDQMIIDEMALKGYTINSVNITVSTSFAAAGEALASGTALIGYLPSTTLVEYEEDGVIPLLLGLRGSTSVTSENPQDWNTGEEITRNYEDLLSFYQGTIIAGPSEYGLILQSIIEKGEKLTWEHLSNASWCINQNTSSAAGSVYPSLWLYENYGKTIKDVEGSFTYTSNGELILGLANESCDVGGQYGFIRSDYQDEWQELYEREDSIWNETSVIGVTAPIVNSTIAISPLADNFSENFYTDIQDALISIINTEDGLAAFSAFNINGLTKDNLDILESTRNAYEFVKQQNQ